MKPSNTEIRIRDRIFEIVDGRLEYKNPTLLGYLPIHSPLSQLNIIMMKWNGLTSPSEVNLNFDLNPEKLDRKTFDMRRFRTASPSIMENPANSFPDTYYLPDMTGSPSGIPQTLPLIDLSASRKDEFLLEKWIQ
ncbi:hypothetical protein JXB41_03595 [Candidatus Woesearchaeota archaeon]|nr:hypothetical protein [Candidatus Woesearchaeota archaeon]